jgi:SMODS-associating 2TM, beta-strand rich effector domain
MKKLIQLTLLPEGDGSWLLMYSYKNEPRTGEPELNAHVGYCEMIFENSMARAEGDYFNALAGGRLGR